MKKELIFSIIIPTYNRSRYLQRCLDSILYDTSEFYEIIVSDNASPDDTEEVIQKYLHHSQLRYFRNQTNLGARENIYKATRYAQGQYIFWLSDDDYLLPDTLSKIIQIIHIHPQVGYIYSPIVTIDDRNGKLFCRRDDFHKNTLIEADLKNLLQVMSSAHVFSRQILKKDLIDWKLWDDNKENAYFMIILVEREIFYVVVCTI